MSWNVVESIVLHVRSTAGDAVVKAGGASNHHIERELSAHPKYTRALVDTGHAARLRDGDASLRVMILDHLPGRLVEGTDAEQQSDTYNRAGALLRELHRQETREDAGYWTRTRDRALSWLDQPNRVDADTASETRHILHSSPTTPAAVVPAHGDWQPRNWLTDGDVVRVIDFGRFGFRPAATDLTRLAAQQWRGQPELETAFFNGYGEDPRDADHWRFARLQEAVGTACWAFQVGDEEFEAQGHRMLAEALAAF
ncbi:phosphotransferase family protein [Microbacterium abyssi]|uniref:phosphotransferase family protein n=1 Tax=Microbacterium abyssi TaxID=2782166 RepID=UPI001E2A8604|nr:aminoglycoside phosphotransferase family protein [Microbacterium sp. A18JL241]